MSEIIIFMSRMKTMNGLRMTCFMEGLKYTKFRLSTIAEYFIYIMARRFAARRKAESDLLKKTIMDDAEESVERFWKYGNLSKRYPRPDLLLRKADMKIFG